MKMPFLAILLLLLRIPIHKFPFLQRKLFSRSIVLQRFSPETLGSLGMSGTTADLCRFLQHTLDRPVIDEALLDGPFDFHVPADETRSFSDRLRDHCGLTLTAEQRTIEMVVFRPT
jgi:hypothetical protein